MSIKIIKDINLINEIFTYDVILIGTSILSTLSRGFQFEIKLNFPHVNEVNINAPYGDLRRLGVILPIEDKGIIFCICPINAGGNTKQLVKDRVFVNYEAIEKCLKTINEKYKGKKIGSTILGVDKFEGNGDKARITQMFEDICTDVDVTLYDYVQESANERLKRIWKKVDESEGSDEYKEIKKKAIWEIRHGIWNPMPDDFKARKIKKRT